MFITPIYYYNTCKYAYFHDITYIRHHENKVLLVITAMILCQLMHLCAWCTLIHCF